MAKIDKLISLATEHLQQGEVIIATVMGTYETKSLGSDTIRTGIFIATDSRLLFYGKRTFGFDTESYPYSAISSFEHKKVMMGNLISFFASGNKVSMKWITTGDIPLFISTVRDNMGRKTATPQAEVKSVASDIPDQIKKMAELRDAGILTEDEFSSKKKQLLNL